MDPDSRLSFTLLVRAALQDADVDASLDSPTQFVTRSGSVDMHLAQTSMTKEDFHTVITDTIISNNQKN